MNDTRSAQLVFHFSIRNFRFPTKLLYVLLRTLPDPFGIPGTPRSLRLLVRDGLPGFYPPVLQPTHDARIPGPSGRWLTDGTRQRW